MAFSKQKGSDKKKGLCKLAADSDMSIYAAAKNHQELMKFYADFDQFEIGVEQRSRDDSTQMEAADEVIRGVINRYSDSEVSLSASANAIIGISRDIQDAINDSLVSLQFQDRASQIIENMVSNIDKAEFGMVTALDAIESGELENASNAMLLLEQMKNQYTTTSERSIHGEISGENYDESENQQSGEVSFF